MVNTRSLGLGGWGSWGLAGLGVGGSGGLLGVFWGSSGGLLGVLGVWGGFVVSKGLLWLEGFWPALCSSFRSAALTASNLQKYFWSPGPPNLRICHRLIVLTGAPNINLCGHMSLEPQLIEKALGPAEYYSSHPVY